MRFPTESSFPQRASPSSGARYTGHARRNNQPSGTFFDARSDALNSAVAAVEDWGVSSEALRETLEVLAEMGSEATRNFKAYGRQIGLVS